MSSLISSLKRGGFERSRLSDNSISPPNNSGRSVIADRFCAVFLLVELFIACSLGIPFAKSEPTVFAASKSAAAQCRVKLIRMEDFASKLKPGQTQTTRLSEDEINSYLALDLSAQYHPCLKSLILDLEENKLNGTAMIDFDRLGMASTKLLPKLASFLFSGTHTITASGQLISKDGKAHLKLERALFDSGSLPKSLVEKIISAVGKKQQPPFDPVQPSQMPYKINKVEVHAGYIIVYQ